MVSDSFILGVNKFMNTVMRIIYQLHSATSNKRQIRHMHKLIDANERRIGELKQLICDEQQSNGGTENEKDSI